MDLKGVSVLHISLGAGIVTEHTGNYLTIAFQNKIAKFLYPDAFENFLIASAPDVQSAILNEIATITEEREKAKKTEYEKKLAFEASRRTTESVTQKRTTSRQYIPASRINGKRLTYFVFQGKTFSEEYTGGYMWAPVTNKVGTIPHHWARMTEVRKGDIVFHGCKGYIQAISVAKDSYYDCPQPQELTVEDMWDRDGRRIDCDYEYLSRPIKPSEFAAEISQYSNIKYSPFKSDGTGNMGYLFNLNQELAKLFAKIAVEQNPQLSSVDFIVDFLSEK